MKTFKTIVTTGAILLTLTGIAAAADTKGRTSTPIVTPVAAAEKTNPHSVKVLFTKDGCTVQEFYVEGTRHLLVTGAHDASCGLK